jgi:protein arginine N-methyltransferase 1
MSMVELHRLMLRDRQRNRQFATAIAQVVKSGDVVIDLGAGTGFLAMAAARAGAQRVYAIEAADIAGLGREITEHNGFGKIVRWIAQPSTEVTLSQRADVLVSEIFGSHPFEENAHEFIRDARKRLLKPGARIVPRAVRVFVAAANFSAQRDDWDLFAAPIEGFDFSRLRSFAIESMYAHEGAELLSPAILLEEVELGGDTKSRRMQHAELTVTQAGELSGLVQWFELDLADGVQLSTAPDQPRTHWRQIFYPLREPRPVQAGERLRVEIALDTRVDQPLSVRWKIE